MKRWISLFLSLTLLFSLMAGASSFAAGAEETKDAHEWQTDIRLGYATERMLRQEAGMDLKQWDEAVAAARQAGLADPVTREAMLAADAGAEILEENGQVYQLGPSSLYGPVNSPEDAYRLAYRLAETLGGSAMTELMMAYRLTINENTVYSFLQLCDIGDAVGPTVKIMLDGNNQVTAVTAYIDPEFNREMKRITREEAEAEAAARAGSEALAGYTDRNLTTHYGLGYALDMGKDETDPQPADLCWIVYTAATENAEEYPYTAHYIRIDGEYMRSLPVKAPGTPEALTGFRKPDIFAGMTPDTYTGELTDIDGNVKTVTVPVMRNEADGCWYLGDAERRIAFADYYEAAYGENHSIVLIKNEDNKSWEEGDIRTFYNYLRAWQFYADMGWTGPDGEGTDVLIFKEICFSDKSPIDNAFSFGFVENWQGFAYCPVLADGSQSTLTWGLDVMAHEYTHTFTSILMNQNLYRNDGGAINEAMSDIMGNLIEYICQDTEDTQWVVGENSGIQLRNMSAPETLGQPKSVWGKYYVPQAGKPNAVNDYGGVHYNSSMLNLIASRLCLEYGMSYEEAVRLWVLTAAGITPETDYIQMSTLLPRALEAAGESDRYGEALSRLTEETRIGTTGIPETLPEGQKIVRLTLPDTPAFRDNKNWLMIITQMDVKTQEEIRDAFIQTVTGLIESPDSRKEFTDGLRTLMENLKIKTSEMAPTELVLDKEKADSIENDLLKKIAELFEKANQDIVKGKLELYSWEEMDSGVIPAVVDDKPTVYMLMNASAGASKLEKIVYLIGSSWYDLTDFMLNDAYNEDETAREKLIKISKELGKQGLRNLLGALKNEKGTGGKTPDGRITIEELPNTGLEYIVLEPAE